MKKILSIALLLALMVSLLAGCSSGAATTAAPAATTAAPAAGETTAAPAPSGDAGTYALIVKNTGNPYNEKEAEGFVKAVESLVAK
jgi:rhamnose transport system substrate-binding protein